VSSFERLLHLYSEFEACPQDSPERPGKLRVFKDAVLRASQDGSFNDQLPPTGIEAWVESTWQDRQRAQDREPR
jgi:hypothetical protein